ncbi:MAG: hypothetical protein A3H97_23080 [Acidobacteria bacterium RIFCSPLOWO2_02_FULL_65_29]|nr:MAG: hypothetical protein A3H97_23080 [Acidobacteria bacterium RIFCSPLOWO2_02_FULL_65_29]
MPIRDWLRPPRQVIVVFLAVALVSAGGLGWLAWQLLAQEKALEIQRRQERLEQAADRAAALMQQSLADLQARVGPQSAANERLPSGVSVVSIGPGGATVTPPGSILYYPFPRTALEADPKAFVGGERLEFAPTPTRARGRRRSPGYGKTARRTLRPGGAWSCVPVAPRSSRGNRHPTASTRSSPAPAISR